MGSVPSSTSPSPSEKAKSTPERKKAGTEDENRHESPTEQQIFGKSTNHQKAIPDGLSGMQLVNYVCRKKKKTYDTCVQKWYNNEFVASTGTLNQEEVCGDVFEAYRLCMLKCIKREFFDKEGLVPGLGSELHEIVDDHGEGDRVKNEKGSGRQPK
jgi:hypothetical protein